eukprot:UN33899
MWKTYGTTKEKQMTFITKSCEEASQAFLFRAKYIERIRKKLSKKCDKEKVEWILQQNFSVENTRHHYYCTQVAVKRLRALPLGDRKNTEIDFLKECGNSVLIPTLIYSKRLLGRASYILPYCQHERFEKYYRKFSIQDVQLYMRKLLEALQHVHNHNWIHRDIKPSNVLYTPIQKYNDRGRQIQFLCSLILVLQKQIIQKRNLRTKRIFFLINDV